jgi:hypothetical protein
MQVELLLFAIADAWVESFTLYPNLIIVLLVHTITVLLKDYTILFIQCGPTISENLY